jgi:hypothetical protein
MGKPALPARPLFRAQTLSEGQHINIALKSSETELRVDKSNIHGSSGGSALPTSYGTGSPSLSNADVELQGRSPTAATTAIARPSCTDTVTPILQQRQALTGRRPRRRRHQRRRRKPGQQQQKRRDNVGSGEQYV